MLVTWISMLVSAFGIPASAYPMEDLQPSVEFNNMKIQKLALKTISVLKAQHAIFMVPQHYGENYDTSGLLKHLWAEGITGEIHTIPRFGVHVSDASSNATENPQRSATSASFLPHYIDWEFLYMRDLLPRRYIVMVLFGPVEWVVPAAVQLMARKVFSTFDTLVIAASKGEVKGEDLCPYIPLAVRVAVLQLRNTEGKRNVCEGTVSEASLLQGGRYALQNVGCWEDSQLHLTRPLLPMLTSFKGAFIKTAFVKGFNEITSTWRDGRQYLGSSLGNVLMKFKSILDFNLELIEVEGFGTKGPNGSFSGVIGFMERWDADFACASLSLLPERNAVLDFTEWFGMHNTRFITKVPKIVHNQFLLFQIYSWQVWCVILVVMLVAAVFMALTWGRKDGTVYTAVSTAFKTAVYTTSVHLPQTTSGRLVHTSMWMVMIMLVSVYSGNLTAFLSIPRVSRPPETIRELTDQGYRLSISKGFSQYAKMQTSPIEDQQIAFKQAKFRQDLGIIPDAVYIEEVKTEPIAMLVTVMATPIVIDSNAYKDKAGKVCTLKTGSEALFLEIGSMAFPRNSPIKYYIDKMVVWLRNTGQVPTYDSKCLKADLRRDTEKPLGLLEMGGVIVLWAAGAGLAFACFVLELMLDCA